MLKSKLRLMAVAAVVAHVFALPAAMADSYPNRPVSWMLGFAPGGVSDSGARFVAKVFSEKLGQPVIVENKPGAGGIIAAESIAAAKPDGYAILNASNGVMAALSTMNSKSTFDPLTAFTIIHGYRSSPLILVVPANSPFKTLQDLLEYARKNPERLNYGSVGPGSSSHLVTELLAQHGGVKLTHVPYKGSAPAVNDLLGGRIDLMFDFSILLKPQIDAGTLRPLAQTGAVRMAGHSAVPTFVELGYPEVQFSAWVALVGPAGMPQAVVDKLSVAFAETLKDPRVVKFHDDQGVVLMSDTGASQMRAFVIAEAEKFKRIIERTGAKAE